MSTQLTGDSAIKRTYLESKVTLVAEAVSFVLSVYWEGGNLWKYNLSGVVSENATNARLAYGRIIAADYHAAAIRAAQQLAQGYQPGTIERGLFDALARGELDQEVTT
jgi:hypothetical protein